MAKAVRARRQPLPQRGLGDAVDALGRLPLLDQLAKALAAGLPVRGLLGDALGLGDDALLDALGLGPGHVAGGLDLLTALGDQLGQRVEPLNQRAQVADGVRVGHGLAQT
ncbi:hypothetical protein GCM10020219_017900 [Nonomuraea dietziae]